MTWPGGSLPPKKDFPFLIPIGFFLSSVISFRTPSARLYKKVGLTSTSIYIGRFSHQTTSVIWIYHSCLASGILIPSACGIRPLSLV